MDGNWHTDPFGGLDDKERMRAARVLGCLFVIGALLAVVAMALEEYCGIHIP